ncbi:hypothetical protein PsAD2_01161 [Pseudovibrio axinellae]|uniref:DUF11 domain-containing protein n=1 Tax=Pseudovibrio axinellae TaxID=989403 RepID=A0A166A6J8_9HYPH|nr:DUF11 domain-containing protein [Pseudovibrio axinellae]KZL20674.1 hypothetical protein PsAD2_01161 [Pseudovibrio axinellae]SER26100.1 hypothetical protein SAMN05421798_107216 [Pseudovibrio axinellae]
MKVVGAVLDWLRPSQHILQKVLGVIIYITVLGPAAAAPIERISVNEAGEEANGESAFAVASRDGRYVVFVSNATNLVEGDVNGHPDVFLKDRETGEVELISVASDNTQGNDWSGHSFAGSFRRMDITPDGRFVVFESGASNLVPGDNADSLSGVYLRDRETEQTELISFTADGDPSPAFSNDVVGISDDGRYVVYLTADSSYDTGDDVTFIDAVMRDRQEGTSELVNLNSAGEQSAPGGDTNVNNIVNLDISGDGRYVVFDTRAPNLVLDDTNDARDIFLRDTLSATTIRVSVAHDDSEANGPSHLGSIGADGRYVVFTSSATNLVPDAEEGEIGLYVRDLVAQTTERILLDPEELIDGELDTASLSYGKNISQDGRFIMFDSDSDALVDEDENEERDVYRHERATGETRLLSRGLLGGAGSEQSEDTSISEDGRVVVFASAADNLVPDDSNNLPDVFATGDILPSAHPYEYAAKIVCGDQADAENLQLTQGRYATTVNVHNPKPAEVAFSKKLALSIPPGRQEPGAIMPIDVHELEYDQALAVDCDDLRLRLFSQGFPEDFIEGFLVFESQGPLDVIAVYTSAQMDPEAPERVLQSSIDIEQVAERQRSADLMVTKTAFVAPFAEVSDQATFYIALYTIGISNTGPDTASGVILRDELLLDVTNALGASAIAFDAIDLPPGASLTNSEIVSPSLSTFEVEVGELAPGATKTVNFGALLLVFEINNLEPNAALRDIANVSSLAQDANPGNNTSVIETVVVP